MRALLYRQRLDLDSGAGQLMRMQAEGLKAAGIGTRVACRHGSLAFLLRTGRRARRLSAEAAARAARSYDLVVDHGAALPGADCVFVHNVEAETVRHVARGDARERVAREAAYFAALDPRAVVVANSALTRAALVGHHGVDASRIVVHYPGYDARRFDVERVPALRRAARRALGLGPDTPLVGLVTSGDLDKRGLDIFFRAAEAIAAEEPAARFLVVGSKRLPDWAARHPLTVTGRLRHRPKCRRPERWFAALDLFLYTARFEEFGIVISEAQAFGLPVLTSRRVGAAECLPDAYDRWLVAEPESEVFARRSLELLGDEASRRALGRAGLASVTSLRRERYVTETLRTLLERAGDQKRRLR